MRDQQKMAIECLNVERMGLNVLSYLQQAYGCISPRATWQRLQLNYLGRTLKTMTDGREKKEMFTRKVMRLILQRISTGSMLRLTAAGLIWFLWMQVHLWF